MATAEAAQSGRANDRLALRGCVEPETWRGDFLLFYDPWVRDVERFSRFGEVGPICSALLCIHATASNPDSNTSGSTIHGRWAAGLPGNCRNHSVASCFHTLYGAKSPLRTANPLRPACFPAAPRRSPATAGRKRVYASRWRSAIPHRPDGPVTWAPPPVTAIVLIA